MSKYDKIKKDNDDQREIEQQLNFASQGMEELVEDTRHTANIYNNAESVLNDIDEKFQNVTSLNGADVSFLFFSVALQCVRQYFITNRKNRLTDQEAAKQTKGHNEEHSSRKRGEWFLPTIEEIITNPVPYDAQRQTKTVKNTEALKGAGQLGHRLTLGHDPILGWIFGTSNIATSTLTNWKMKSYHIKSQAFSKVSLAKIDYLSSPVDTLEMLEVAFDRFFNNGIEGLSILATSLAKEWIHLKSDIGTKNSLPLPIISTISPEIANSLAKYGLDMGNIVAVAKQATFATAINTIIAMLHGMYCYLTSQKISKNNYVSKEELDIVLKLSQVRTRKILILSNIIASSSNLITVALMEVLGTKTGNSELIKKGWQYLDIGGLAVTAYRLVSDTKFINEIKREFLEKEWYNSVVGNEYKFVAEVKEMGKKDILKGIEIQAKADAAKAEKVAEGLAVHAEVLSNIKDTQHTVHQKVDVVLQDMRDQEANTLYGLRTNKRLFDLDYTEKRVFSAVIYTLMANSDYISDLQRKFFACVESYGVSERVSDFNFDNLRNIDSYSDRKIILKAICAFLFLKEFTFDFKNNENYEWLATFTSQMDVDEVCKDIEKEFSILGGDGIVNGYSLPIAVSGQSEIKELPEPETVEETVEDDMSDDYAQLFETIEKVACDEKTFGKRVLKLDQAFVNRELGKEYPNVSAGAVVEAIRIANGCLIFSTYALYLKVGNILNGKYVRLPYKKIIADKMYTGEGKLKGTRKLIIPYINEIDECVSVEIDDIKVEEEKLRDLLTEIASLDCAFSSTDENTQFINLDKKILILFATIVISVLKKNNHLLTEAYLTLKEYDIHNEWNQIVAFDNYMTEEMIDLFINSIPHPSELFITDYAMQTFMRIMTRTNRIEGNEATVLMKDEEALIKHLDVSDRLSNAEFNILLKDCSKDIRKLSLDELNEIINDVENSDILFKDSVIAGLQKMIEAINAEEEAKKNTPTAKLKRAVQDNAMPAAKKVVEKAEEQLKQIKFPSKKSKD